MGTIETDRFESVNSPPWISGMVAFAKRGILFLIAFYPHEVDRLLVLNKFTDKSSLPHTATAIYNCKFKFPRCI